MHITDSTISPSLCLATALLRKERWQILIWMELHDMKLRLLHPWNSALSRRNRYKVWCALRTQHSTILALVDQSIELLIFHKTHLVSIRIERTKSMETPTVMLSTLGKWIPILSRNLLETDDLLLLLNWIQRLLQMNPTCLVLKAQWQTIPTTTRVPWCHVLTPKMKMRTQNLRRRITLLYLVHSLRPCWFDAITAKETWAFPKHPGPTWPSRIRLQVKIC